MALAAARAFMRLLSGQALITEDALTSEVTDLGTSSTTGSSVTGSTFAPEQAPRPSDPISVSAENPGQLRVFMISTYHDRAPGRQARGDRRVRDVLPDRSGPT